jgi:hypothetical protein
MKQEPKVCKWCGKPGGRLVIDPYEQDVNNTEVMVRLHKACERALVEEI